MDKYVLSEDEHAEILEDIKMTSYEGKKSSENPKLKKILVINIQMEYYRI